MASNRFALHLLLRVLLLSLGTAAYVYAFVRLGLHPLPFALLLAVGGLVYELWLFLQRTNRELERFLASARHADFSQNFDFDGLGCGFPALGTAFGDILTRLKELRLAQELELRQLRAMVDHMPVPLLAVYGDGHVQQLNNAARRFFGRHRPARLQDLAGFGPDLQGCIHDCRPGEKRLVGINIDGSESQVLISLTALTSDSGTVNLVSLQDIGQELALAQLGAWQDLVRVLTHEIMNSITPVASLAQTTADMAAELQVTAADDDAQRSALERIRDTAGTVARRAGNLTQFVANYRQIAGLPEPVRHRLNVRELLAHATRVALADDAAARIGLDIDVEPSGLEVHADPEQLEQALINLLRNAEQALAGRQNGHVVLAGFLDARGRVTLEVRDNGAGIDMKILSKIFVPYFTTKPGGSGIGLALARQIMMAHGGGIRARNGDDGGAVFTLTF